MAPLARYITVAVALGFFSHAIVATPAVIAHSLQRPLRDDDRPHKTLTGKFLHITDFHPDPNYKPYTSTDENASCHRGTGPSGYWGAQMTDCDSPRSLVNATFDWIAANVRDDIDFVVWTGDSARHDRDEKESRDAADVLRMNRWIADKFVETFAIVGKPQGQWPRKHDNDDSSLRLAIPVVPSLGNNDFLPHNIFRPGPNEWLARYHEIWRHFIPEEQSHSFQFGGWFMVEVVPDCLAVISLNTMYFFTLNAAADGCATANQPGYQQFEWLRTHLQLLRERGVKAIIIGHVPPARTKTKQLWDESCWQKYTLWLRQYRDVITASLYGHMNIDHFIIADIKDIGSLLDRKGVEPILSFGAVDLKAGGEEDDEGREEATPDELTIQSKGSYLAELRSYWTKLPRMLEPKSSNKESGRGGPHGGKWGERYSLAMVNPSIIPTYFPTMRIYEYNITGLEDTAVWSDTRNHTSHTPSCKDEDDEEDENVELLGQVDAVDPVNVDNMNEFGELKRDLGVDSVMWGKKKHEKKKMKKKKKHDPNLIIPSPPSKTAQPGPAYSPQRLTLTGYTQWFANLTRLNNMPAKDSPVGRDQKPPRFLPLEFEVEYSTFADEWYRVPDLTIRTYVNLAYNIARGSRRSDDFKVGFKDNGDEDDEDDEDDDDDDNDGDDDLVDVDGGNKMKKHGKHKKKKQKHKDINKFWLRFLDRAFVGTVPEEDLDQWDG